MTRLGRALEGLKDLLEEAVERTRIRIHELGDHSDIGSLSTLAQADEEQSVTSVEEAASNAPDLAIIPANSRITTPRPVHHRHRRPQSKDSTHVRVQRSATLKSQRSSRCVAGKSLVTRFLDLPPELQLIILSYLNFGDIERLRRTCRLFRTLISKPLIRSLFPNLKIALQGTCYLCLSNDNPAVKPSLLVRADERDARYPLANRCVDCVAKKGEFIVGRKYVLGNYYYSTVWVCRWCGLPVSTAAAWNQPEFHRGCYRVYNKVLLLYFAAGCTQWAIVIIAPALCWSFFKEDTMVLAPTIINFIMAFWAFCLTLLRGPTMRTYHWALIVETAIAALWIPPIYAIFNHIQQHPGPTSMSTQVTLCFIGLNVLFRVLNIIGNVVLMLEYKRWRQRQRRHFLTVSKRVLVKFVSIMILWTYPQSIEQEYPPTWWFERRSDLG